MSVVVDQLTKAYGQQKVLDKVSFEAPKGMVTGFLGPNGAGKTTTMKIATGYLPFDFGTVRVNGLNVGAGPIKVKRSTGYLPEHNPLYLDMYVKEYLSFIAYAYRLNNKRKKVAEMIALCGLELEQKKKIRALSKGYRQRVGLAQALVHDPEVLILDEPTGGLDPNQLVGIRKMIREASKAKTVILSTHIMQEVEALCDKVVIINRGKIVANSNVSDLKSRGSHETGYKVSFEKKIDPGLFKLEKLSIQPMDPFTYIVTGPDGPRKKILKVVTEHGLPLVSIIKEEQTLEGVFQELTKEE